MPVQPCDMYPLKQCADVIPSVTAIGILRIVLYYYRFKPDNIDRSYSVSYTVSGMETNIAIIAACGPALKALCTHYGLRWLGGSITSGPSGDVYYYPQSYGRSGGRPPNSKTAQTDAQYGMQDLGTKNRDGNSASQEAIIRSESVVTKGEFDFGLEGDQVAHATPKGGCSSHEQALPGGEG